MHAGLAGPRTWDPQKRRFLHRKRRREGLLWNGFFSCTSRDSSRVYYRGVRGCHRRRRPLACPQENRTRHVGAAQRGSGLHHRRHRWPLCCAARLRRDQRLGSVRRRTGKCRLRGGSCRPLLRGCSLFSGHTETIRADLRAYVQSVVDDGWKKMAAHQSDSPRTDRQLRALFEISVPSIPRRPRKARSTQKQCGSLRPGSRQAPSSRRPRRRATG